MPKLTYRLETLCSIENGCQAMETNSYLWFGPLEMICSLGDGIDRCDEGVFVWNWSAFSRKVFGNGKSTFLHLSNVIRFWLLEMRRSHPGGGGSQGAQTAQSLLAPKECENNGAALNPTALLSFPMTLANTHVGD